MDNHVPTDDRNFITRVIRTHLPTATILAFGSRIDGSAKPYSDLDIGIDKGQPLTFKELGILQETFASSHLTYKVDITDMHRIDDSFAALIRSKAIVW